MVALNVICQHCKEPILPGEPLAPVVNAKIHQECGFRMTSGSVGHMKKECFCYGKVDTSEEGMTLRQAARASWDYFQANLTTRKVNLSRPNC